MKKNLFLLLLFFSLVISVKTQSDDNLEKEAVKLVVETYLFSELDAERQQTLFSKAKIFSTDMLDNKIEETPFSVKKKIPKGTKITSVQKIVNIDISENGAIVKVETDLSTADRKIPKHFQYISLLKAAGQWKIVSILMPRIKFM